MPTEDTLSAKILQLVNTCYERLSLQGFRDAGKGGGQATLFHPSFKITCNLEQTEVAVRGISLLKGHIFGYIY